MVQVTPIQEGDLSELGEFLHQHLNRRIAPQAWMASLTHRWAAEQPNYGMQLRDGDGKLVGAICAIYSDQWIDGKLERFCNPHSWFVLDEHRGAGIRLVLELLKQRGYHFTMFTPNPKVAQVFLGLRFRMLDDRVLNIANLPSLGRRGDGFVEADPARIEARLEGASRQEFLAHRDIPWLRFVAFGRPGDACLAIYKPGIWKKLRCAWVSHLSDPAAMQRHGHLLRHHLLVHCGMPVLQVEARILAAEPRLARLERRGQPKLVSSRTLTDGQVRDVYSELMSLDL